MVAVRTTGRWPGRSRRVNGDRFRRKGWWDAGAGMPERAGL